MVEYVLNYSLENKVPIVIVYAKGLEITQRTVKVMKDDGKIIYAYCYKRKANRKFIKDNILAAMVNSAPYLHSVEGVAKNL
ncbi:hypothetical protein [Alkaliphilus transvaalensis]|uniref:hypothetical protein n=1 Tax=Alkaliphilus transvaalensis TaxID=114628 RepID=UPI0006872C73|nr:hypothetical protein [Alkaliphilus transvaalensis]